MPGRLVDPRLQDARRNLALAFPLIHLVVGELGLDLILQGAADRSGGAVSINPSVRNSIRAAVGPLPFASLD